MHKSPQSTVFRSKATNTSHFHRNDQGSNSFTIRARSRPRLAKFDCFSIATIVRLRFTYVHSSASFQRFTRVAASQLEL